NKKHGYNAREPYHVHYYDAIFSGRRIVVIAIEHQRIDRGSNFVLRSLDQTKTQISRDVINAIKISRQPVLRRRDHYSARVRELFRLFIPRKMKADRFSHSLNVRLVTGEKMPATFAARAVVTLDISLLLFRGQLRCLFRVKTYGNYLELFAKIERSLTKRRQHAIQNLIAKHRARVIDQREHHRFSFEELNQAHFAALLIFENSIQRNLLVQPLIDANFLERRRQAGRNLTRI